MRRNCACVDFIKCTDDLLRHVVISRRSAPRRLGSRFCPGFVTHVVRHCTPVGGDFGAHIHTTAARQFRLLRVEAATKRPESIRRTSAESWDGGSNANCDPPFKGVFVSQKGEARFEVPSFTGSAHGEVEPRERESFARAAGVDRSSTDAKRPIRGPLFSGTSRYLSLRNARRKGGAVR